MANKKDIQFEQPSELLILVDRYRYIIFSVVIITVFVLGYFFILKPKINSNYDLQIELSQIQSNQLTSEHLLGNLEKLNEQYEEIKESRQNDLDRLRQIIPTNPQIAELFIIANKLAVDKGFKLTDITIAESPDNNTTAPAATQNVNALDTTAPANVAATPGAAPQAKVILKSLTLQINILKMSPQELAAANPSLAAELSTANKSNYQLFKEYLSAVQDNLRLFDIKTVAFGNIPEINPGSNAGQTPALPSFTFSVVTYYK